MEKLDLHNISHLNAEGLIEEFIINHYKKFPIEIITGNSLDMQNILKTIVKNHNLRITPSHAKNLGSYIINDSL